MLPYELESPEYWRDVDYVLSFPGMYASNYSRPIFEAAPLHDCICHDDCHSLCT